MKTYTAEEIKPLLDALKFYADGSNFKIQSSNYGMSVSIEEDSNNADDTMGAEARKALSTFTGEK